MKKILGLDLGTNSIGWALVDQDEQKILGMGSRIVPMGAELSKFEQGRAQTKNAVRRTARGIRRLNKRYKQRRNKLIYTLQQLEMLPDQIKLASPFSDPNRIDKISILPISKNQKQLTAFDLVELRVKALNEKVTLQEFGRILYLFNQLRGYSGGNAEPEKETDDDNEVNIESKNKNPNIITLCKILKISNPEQIIFKGKNINKRIIEIELEDERISEKFIQADTFLETLKENDILELNIKESTNKKEGTSYFVKLPSKTSWRKKMENLEKELKDKSAILGREVYLSEHFLEILKENKWAKIRNNVVLRYRYEAEFEAIWDAQLLKNPEFQNLTKNVDLLTKITHFIFPNRPPNKPENNNSIASKKIEYRERAMAEGLKFLIKEQIIFYQRELKDQSDLISFCRFETDKKVVSRSHPVFQEFRIWEQINKLNINTKIEVGKTKKGELKYSYIDKPIPTKLKVWIYDELKTKKEISYSAIFTKLKKEFEFRQGDDFLNGLDSKAKIKTNETVYVLKKHLSDYWDILKLNEADNLNQLWEILYNGKGNEYDIYSERTSKVLKVLKENIGNTENLNELAISISKIKFARNYSSMSIEAIQKIMPLVKAGKYFNNDFIEETHNRIIKLVNENLADPFEKAAQKYLEKNIDLLKDGGIINAYATILIYGNHTTKPISQSEIIQTPQDIKRLNQGDLRNPLAEQMINETLIIVKDIWKQFGIKPDEIRLELARELKNSAERRKKIYKNQSANQKDNENIKDKLQELNQELTLANIEKFKIWASQENLQEKYIEGYKDPNKSEIQKMKLWEEQGHISPYTGKPIPLSDLFNKGNYDVDHIIPKSRYFDDSFTNKIVCETAINRDKGNRTAMEYMESGSTTQSLLNKDTFINEVNKSFYGPKRKNLLANSIPEDPILRQIKDTQYIALRTKEELTKIVGSDNVKSTTGGVTDYLRNQWGLTDKFKKILKGRYEGLLENDKLLENEYAIYIKKIEARREAYRKIDKEFNDLILTKEKFIEWYKADAIKFKNNKLILKDWSKRIDHRHHAIDALVVACTNQSHVQRLNNLNKELQDWLDKNRKELLPKFEGTPSELLDEIMTIDEKKREEITKQLKKFNEIPMPWSGFNFDAENALKTIIVSQKPKDKLLIQKGIDGKPQIKIRGQLHEGTNYGKAGSGENKNASAETYRIPLPKFGGKQFATEKTLVKIVNPYLKAQLLGHLKSYNNKNEEAFSAEGIIDLNKKLNIKLGNKNSHAPHTPISKIKIYYQDPTKKRVSNKNKAEVMDTLQKLDRPKAFNNSLYVKTGDNYLFAIMEKVKIDKKTNETKNVRFYDIITFFDAVNLLKTTFNESKDKENFNKELLFKKHFEEKNKAKLLFTLKQGDYIYLPENEEIEINMVLNNLDEDFWEDKAERSKNIYIVQKYSGQQIYFIKHNIAKSIKKGIEFGSQDCYEKIGDVSIKDKCWKLEIDRLGNIKKCIRPDMNVAEKLNTLADPSSDYRAKKKIKIYKSFEEQKEEEIEFALSQTPEERLRETMELSRLIYQEEIKNMVISKKITIRKAP